MLHIEIINDTTGTEEVGNYLWSAYINGRLLEYGRVTCHERVKGWKALVRLIVEEKEKKS